MGHWNENVIKILCGQHKKVKPDTLFSTYLWEKIDNYVEPWRKGTPKGDPIGMSKIKYQACLFMLTSLMQKEIADKLNVSFGLLRKWNTEDEFKSTLNKNCTEIVEKIARYMNNTIDESIKSARTKTKPDGIAMAQVEFEKLNDNQMYGTCIREQLRDKIYEMIDKLQNDNINDKQPDKAMAMQYFLTYKFTPSKTNSNFEKLYQRSLAEKMHMRLGHILTHNLYDQRRAEADFIMSTLQKYIHKLG